MATINLENFLYYCRVGEENLTEMDIRILKFHISTLEILFLWPRNSLTETANLILLYGLFGISVIFAIPVVCAVLNQFHVGIYNVNILLESLIGICDIVGYTVAYICILKNKLPIEDIINDINMFLQYCPNSVIDETDSLSTRQTKWIFIYVSIGIGFNLGWPLVSRKNCIIERSSDIYLSHDPCGMPTHNYYPFDANQPILFWIVYLLEAIYVCHICYLFSTVTALIIGLLMHVSAQLNHCGYKFEHIGYNREAYACGSLAREFKETVKYHQCVLLYAQRIFVVFRPVLSAYIAMTSFAMAVIAYQIIGADKVQDSVRYTMLLLGWGSLFFLVCLYAQKVQDESVAISNSIYNSGWTDDFFEADIRRSIIITMHRTQEPVELKIACLGTISLSQFISILKSAYSLFALLVTVTERTETPQAK